MSALKRYGVMIGRLKKFISLEISLNDTSDAQTLPVFTGKMVFISIILTIVVSVVVLSIGHFFQMLPLPLWEALAYGVLMAWLVGGCVTMLLCMLLGHAIRRLSQSHAEFERLSKTDTLSGLMNRRGFNQYFDDVDCAASLAIFDLDRFKAINDCYGHPTGDVVIRTVATSIAEVFGGVHCVARLGGEEFAVIILGGLPQDRVALVELARVRVSSLSIAFEAGEVNTTVSVGIADIDESRSKHDIFAAADRALYFAKASGRNRVCHEHELSVANNIESLKASLMAAY